MKKVLTLILALVFIVSLVACGNSSADVDSGSSTEKKAENNKTDSSVIYSTQNIQEFMDTVNSMLDMSDYEITDGYDDGTWMKISRVSDSAKPNLSITIDGYSLALPVKYTDLIDAGWKDTSNVGDEELDSNSITTVEFETTDGKYVVLSFVNQSDDSMKIKDLEAVKLELTNSSLDEIEVIDPPTFTLLDGIKNNSDLEDILSTNAKPTYLDVYDDNEPDTAVTSTIEYSDENDSIEIEYYYTNSTILNIIMECGLSGTTIVY